jgi:hypothetical protein
MSFLPSVHPAPARRKMHIYSPHALAQKAELTVQLTSIRYYTKQTE